MLYGNKLRGLERDYVLQHAKEYSHNVTGAKKQAEELEQVVREQWTLLAARFWQQMQFAKAANAGLKDMDDGTAIDTLYRSQVQPSCHITALTVPTASNNIFAVSLHVADGRRHRLAANGCSLDGLLSCITEMWCCWR